MNMSGAYDLEPLMEGQDFDLVDCQDICGKELICSDEALDRQVALPFLPYTD